MRKPVKWFGKFDRDYDNYQRGKPQGQEEGQLLEREEESPSGLEGSRWKKVISYQRKDEYSVAFRTIHNILLPSPYSTHCLIGPDTRWNVRTETILLWNHKQMQLVDVFGERQCPILTVFH